MASREFPNHRIPQSGDHKIPEHVDGALPSGNHGIAPRVGITRSPSVLMVLHLLLSVLTVLCPLSSMLMVLCPLRSVLTVLCPLRSVATALCPLRSMLTALCPWCSMLMVLCPLWHMMLVLYLIVWAGRAQASWGEVSFSMWCGSNAGWSILALAMLAAVLDAVQKVGGEFIQPIMRDSGTVMSWVLPLYQGMVTASCRASSAWRNTW